jgi:glycerol-3-phosphate acyltransferase PlsY
MKIIVAISSYLLGSIPMGYIFFYLSERKDIRKFGSHSTGATNLLRLKGWKFALPVLVLDYLKGFLPVFFALKFFEDSQFALVCGFLSVLGHCFPLYLKFRGGKGVATTFGAYSILAFKPFLLSLAVFLIVSGTSRYISLGSLLATLSYPFFIILFNVKAEIAYLSFALFFLIMLMHRDNIERLVQGKERKLGEKTR